VATGAALVALFITFVPISGAHFNPAVTLAGASQGGLPWREVPAYIGAQVIGAFAGVAIAHVMFKQPALFFASQHRRDGSAQLVSEFVATFGLLAVIWGSARRRPGLVPFAVGAYITAAYWFTASTSFANPAVTLARAVSDSFAGIRPGDVERVRAMGLDKWFDEQLHPDKINDSALEARIAPFRTLKMSTREMVENFPADPILKAVQNGKMSMPHNSAKKAIYESRMVAMEERQQKKADAKNDAPEDTVKPTPEEIRTCRRFLEAPLAALPRLRLVVALGQIAHQSAVKALGGKLPKARFGHGAEHVLPSGLTLIDSYHCSRYNQNTRVLTPEMFDAVFARAATLLQMSAVSRP